MTMKTKIKFLAFIMTFFSLTTFGQGIFGSSNSTTWNKIEAEFPIKKQFDMDKYKKIIVGDFYTPVGLKAAKGSDLVEETGNQFLSLEGVTVLERQYLANIMKEQKLNSSGLIDESTAIALGKFIGSGLMVVGRIQRDSYVDFVNSTNTFIAVGGCKTTNVREGKYTLTVNIKLLDLVTARLLFSKNIQVFYSRSSSPAFCVQPELFNAEDLYADCLRTFGKEFLNIFKDSKRKVSIELERDSKLDDQLRKAIVNFNIGNIDEGYKMLEDMTKRTDLKDPAKAKAFYNLGIVQINKGDLEEGVKNLQQAYVLQDKNPKYLETYSNAKKQLNGE
jgi:hypothetical protein